MHTNHIARLATLAATVGLLVACSAGPTPTPAPLATQPAQQLAPGADIHASHTPTDPPPTATATSTHEPSSTPVPPSRTPIPLSATPEPSNTLAPTATRTQPPAPTNTRPPSATSTIAPPPASDTLLPPPPANTEPPAPPPPPAANCDSSYPDFCIPPPPPDLDCGDIPQKNFTVLQPDPHRFDQDKDGMGCES